MLLRELEKLETNLGGVADMKRLPRRRLRGRPQAGGARRPRGAPLQHPDHRARRHELRSRRGRLRHPGQRRRDPLLRADRPRDRRRRGRGPQQGAPLELEAAAAAAEAEAEAAAELAVEADDVAAAAAAAGDTEVAVAAEEVAVEAAETAVVLETVAEAAAEEAVSEAAAAEARRPPPDRRPRSTQGNHEHLHPLGRRGQGAPRARRRRHDGLQERPQRDERRPRRRRQAAARAGHREDGASAPTATTEEGVVEAYIHGGGHIGVLVEVGCETDFVASTRTSGVRPRGRDADLGQLRTRAGSAARRSRRTIVEAELDIYARRRPTSPRTCSTGSSQGKLDKWFSSGLPARAAVRPRPDRTIEQLRTELVGGIGENVADPPLRALRARAPERVLGCADGASISASERLRRASSLATRPSGGRGRFAAC